jgi:hypothetical protein
MTIDEILEQLTPVQSEYVALSELSKKDDFVLDRLEKRHGQRFIHLFSMSDRVAGMSQSTSLYLNEQSGLLRTFRIGEPYTKNSGAIDFKLESVDELFQLSELESIQASERGKSFCFEFLKTNGQKIETTKIPQA